MRLLAFIGLLLALPIVSGSPELDMGDENKLSFCAMVNRRIYRQEKLEYFCLLKVQQWETQV